MGKKQKALTQRRADSLENKKNLKRSVEQVQRLVRKHVKRGTSLVDEFIAERREAARNE